MSLKVFSFLVFPKVAGGNNWVQNQLESNNHPPPLLLPVSVSQSMVGLLLADSSSRRYPSSTASTSSIEISQWEHRLRGDWPMRGGKFTDGMIVDATCEGRILSNTSSQRPLGSQGWGWEKFPLGGVFTKPGMMSPLSALPSRQVFSESVENENQII